MIRLLVRINREKRLLSSHTFREKRREKFTGWAKDIYAHVPTVNIPAALGFAVIGIIQWKHLRHSTDQEAEEAWLKQQLTVSGELTEVEKKMASERQMQVIDLLPYRIMSRVWGAVNDLTLPKWTRKMVYNAWTVLFGCNLDEMRYPLEHYENLGEFFSRPLKEGVRKVSYDSVSVSSPSDGRVVVLGSVDLCDGVPLLEQIKGARYRADTFLGVKPTPQLSKSRLYHVVIYLAPGDYHRIHSPADWSVAIRNHFPGQLYPVANWAVRLIPNIFATNERVALTGSWKYGFFSLTAVGAANVGSIHLNMEPELRTNVSGQGKKLGNCVSMSYEPQHIVSRSEEVAQFKLGSTVVLVFEAPPSFQFSVAPGKKVYMGEQIGRVQDTEDDGGGTTFPSPK